LGVGRRHYSGKTSLSKQLRIGIIFTFLVMYVPSLLPQNQGIFEECPIVDLTRRKTGE
jgi:hypothetical protein